MLIYQFIQKHFVQFFQHHITQVDRHYMILHSHYMKFYVEHKKKQVVSSITLELIIKKTTVNNVSDKVINL